MRSRSVMFVAILVVTALVGAAALAAPTSALTSEDYGFISSIGPAYGPDYSWSGSGPNAIDIDPAGNVYVTNPYGFAKFDGSGVLECAYTYGQLGGYCYGLAVSDDGIIVLTEGNSNRVLTLLPLSGGLDAKAYALGVAYGSSGTGVGQFDWPRGVACDGDYVYVCDQGNNRVHKLLLDPVTGVLSPVARFGKNDGDGTAGSGDGEFSSPRGVAADGKGHIYVVESTRVQQLTTDGVFVSKFGAFGQPNAELYLRSAMDADVDAAGDLYVTDLGEADATNWVTKYRKVDGTWKRVTRFGGWGTADDRFQFVYGVCIAPDGTAYVTDTSNNRVKRFARDTIAPAPWATGIPNDWTNQDVTVEMGADDPVFPFAYASGVERVEYSLAPPAWNTYTAPFTVGDEGTHLLSLRAIDLAGNVSLPGMLAIKIDKTAPVTTAVDVPESWSKESVVFTLAGQDPAPAPSITTSGVASTQYRPQCTTDWLTYVAPFAVSVEGETVFEFRSTDNAGNVETPKTVAVRVDKTAPVTEVSGVPSGWTNDTVSAVFQASDAHSGTAATYHKLGGGTWFPGDSVQIDGEGETQLSWYSQDNAGNTETPKTVTVKVDKTAPVTEVSGVPSGWTNGTVSASLQAADALSGLASTQYRLQGAAGWTTYAAPFEVSAEGETLYEVRSTDNAGNTETPKTVAVKVDKTAPVTTVSGVPTGWSKSATVKLEAADALAGVAAVQYRLQGEAAWSPYVGPFTPKQGLCVYEFRSTDNAGNEETPGGVTVKYDRGKPVPKARADRSVRRGQKVSLPYRVNDVCPQAKVSIRIYRGSRLVKTLSLGSRPSNKNLTYSYRCGLARGTYTWKVYAKDLAGNAQAKPGARRLTVK
ncbi:MAG: hypothetical protein GX624_00390 [Actinobacteria bacterium]|nr:hypothetical protein [Actinomycetota bacterium]